MQNPPEPSSDELDEAEDDAFDAVIQMIMTMAGNRPDDAIYIAAQVLQIFMDEGGMQHIEINGVEDTPPLIAKLVDPSEMTVPADTVYH